jgi:hypothetical protein
MKELVEGEYYEREVFGFRLYARAVLTHYGVQLKLVRVTLEDDVAAVDFFESLEEIAGALCRKHEDLWEIAE